MDHLETVRGCSLRTRNTRLEAIRAFFGFLAREEPTLLLHCQTIRAIPLKRTEHKAIDYLVEKEIQAMLDAVDVNSRTGIRDKALLLLLYNTGARVSEIVGLNVTDLRLDDAPKSSSWVMVSYWLGHAHINTTHVYVEIDMDMKRQMLQKARAPAVNNALPWRKPDILQWLSRLAKTPQLCAARNQPNIENRKIGREKQPPLHIIPKFT